MSTTPQEVRDAVAEVDAQFRSLASPLREQLERLDSELETAEALVAGLREARNRARKALATIDPDFAKAPPKHKPGKQTFTVSPKAVDDVAAWLEEHRAELRNGAGGGTFSVWDILEHDGFDRVGSDSYLRAIFDNLHARGMIRLDHVGRRRGQASGGNQTKYFALV